MATITAFSPSLSLPKPWLGLSINLSEIFRSQTFKITAEIITLLSLFTAATAWTLALTTF